MTTQTWLFIQRHFIRPQHCNVSWLEVGKGYERSRLENVLWAYREPAQSITKNGIQSGSLTIFSGKCASLSTESRQIPVHRKRLRVSTVFTTYCAVNLSLTFFVKVAISMLLQLLYMMNCLLTPNSRANPTPNTSRRYGLDG